MLTENQADNDYWHKEELRSPGAKVGKYLSGVFETRSLLIGMLDIDKVLQSDEQL